MSWEINKNPEGKGSDAQLADIKRRGADAAEYILDVSDRAIDKAAETMKLTGKAKRKALTEDAAYVGLGTALIGFVEQSMVAAEKETLKDMASMSSEVLDAAKVLVMANILRELVENADKIKEL